jgi:type IV secretory pathway VirB4 component
MEYLIMIGGLLSLPIIHYCNQPSPALKPSKPSEPEEAPRPSAKPLSEEELQDLKKKAEERKARVLKDLTPYEKELLNEYLENLKNPKKYPQSLNLLIAIIVFLIVFLVILLISIYSDSPKSSKPSEL